MSDECINLDKLAAPFAVDKIHWRVGATSKDKTSCIALAYVDARDVMQRLDEVVGRGNWQCDYPWSESKRLVCRIGIKVRGEWVWKSNGAGDTNVEAEKGAFSDAFKRAGVLWGIAQYLYDIPNTWVKLDQYKKIAASEMGKLKKSLGGAPPKQQANKTPTFSEKMQSAKKSVGAKFFNDCLEGHGCKTISDVKPEQQEEILNDLRKERDRIAGSQNMR